MLGFVEPVWSVKLLIDGLNPVVLQMRALYILNLKLAVSDIFKVTSEVGDLAVCIYDLNLKINSSAVAVWRKYF